jgi:hypothetical protein
MKKVRYLSLVIGVSLLSILTGCNSNNGQNNQSISEQQYTNNEDVSANEPYANEEDVSSQYILIPHTVYKGTIDGGFDPLTGELTTDKKHNETSFEIQAYKDGGITFSFDNKVYEEGWGFNMSGQLEGNWDEKSFSHHDVEYNYIIIKCKNSIYPTYYEDSNHTPKDFKHIETLIVQMIVDKDLNVYFSDNELINHMPAGKLVR